MLKDKSKTLLTVLIVILSIFAIANSLGTMHHIKQRSALLDTEKREAKALATTKLNYQRHKERVETQTYNAAINSDDSVVKSVAVHNARYKALNHIAEKFFKVYYTWNNTKDYLERSEKLANIISPNLKTNKSIFDDGKDTTGHDYIKNTGIHGQFVSAIAYPEDDGTQNLQEALVEVKYQTWFNSNQNEAATATKYYEITYDQSQQKLTNIQLILTTDLGSTSQAK